VTINQVAAPNVIVPVITASRTTGVAPLAITFDALATTAPLLTALTFSEIRYFWRFGDDRGTFWMTGANPGGNNKNEAYGPVAKHVFETSGNYTVELVASHINNAGQLIQTTVSRSDIVVTNADTVFASNTIYISQSGVPVPGVGGVPMGANVQQVTNWTTLQTLAQTYKRILLRRGDTWDINGGITFGASQAGPGIIGAYGTGNKPVISQNIDTVGMTFGDNGDDWRLIDLKVTSNDLAYFPFSRAIMMQHGSDLLLLRTDVEKAGRILVEAGTNEGYTDLGHGMYIVDSVIGPVGATTPAICLYTSSVDRLGVLGCTIIGSKDHGTRWQGTALSVFSNNTSSGHRDGSHCLTIRGKANAADQTTWLGRWTENVVVSDNAITGSAGSLAVLRIHPQNNVSAERLRNVLVERNLLTSIASEVMSTSVVSGFTVRNNILRTNHSTAIDVRAESSVGSPPPSQNFFYNNTVYKADVSVVNGLTVLGFVGSAGGGISGVVATNNLAYAPIDTAPVFTNGTGGQVTLANNSSNAQIKNNRPWASTTPVAAVDYTPSGSYAVDAGAWVPVYDNYFRTVNTLPREIGAI
jgi:hypothetical protein